jgi:hypothetical protein
VFHRSTIDIENSVLVPGARFLAAPAPGSDQTENRVVLGKRRYLIAAHRSCTLQSRSASSDNPGRFVAAFATGTADPYYWALLIERNCVFFDDGIRDDWIPKNRKTGRADRMARDDAGDRAV